MMKLWQAIMLGVAIAVVLAVGVHLPFILFKSPPLLEPMGEWVGPRLIGDGIEDEVNLAELQLENTILHNLASAQEELIDLFIDEALGSGTLHKTYPSSGSWARVGDTFHIPSCTTTLSLNYLKYIRLTPGWCDIVTLSTSASGSYTFPQIGIDEEQNIFIYTIHASDLEGWYLPGECYDDYSNAANWHRHTNIDGE